MSIATRLKNFRKNIHRQLYDYFQDNSLLNTYQYVPTLRLIRSLISQSTAIQIYDALIQPHWFWLLCHRLGWIEFLYMWETTKIAKPSS